MRTERLGTRTGCDRVLSEGTSRWCELGAEGGREAGALVSSPEAHTYHTKKRYIRSTRLGIRRGRRVRLRRRRRRAHNAVIESPCPILVFSVSRSPQGCRWRDRRPRVQPDGRHVLGRRGTPAAAAPKDAQERSGGDERDNADHRDDVRVYGDGCLRRRAGYDACLRYGRGACLRCAAGVGESAESRWFAEKTIAQGRTRTAAPARRFRSCASRR